MAASYLLLFVIAALGVLLILGYRRALEMKSLSDRYHESELRFSSVADNLREAVLITDREDWIVVANASVRNVLGYDPAEVIGKNATTLLLPAAQRNVFSDRLRRRLEGESETYQTEMIRKDGSIMYAEVSASPYRNGSGVIVGTLGAISDVSDRKRLEDRLHHALRMEAVGRLAGGVAHDFNNLLTIIKCHTDVALGEVPSGAARDAIIEIEHAADRGARLTRQLLAFSRKQFLRPRIIDLGNAVTQSLPTLRRLVPDTVRFVFLYDGSSIHVFADAMQLDHVVLSLVENACEAMPQGGELTLSIERTRVPQTAADAHDVAPGDYAVVSVTDSGEGMDAATLSRLFEPFFTTKPAYETSGLGLASAYGIVRQTGGFIDVRSAIGQGTTFRIHLPIAAALPTSHSEPRSALSSGEAS